jgi:hypothetical protein
MKKKMMSELNVLLSFSVREREREREREKLTEACELDGKFDGNQADRMIERRCEQRAKTGRVTEQDLTFGEC